MTAERYIPQAQLLPRAIAEIAREEMFVRHEGRIFSHLSKVAIRICRKI